MSIETDIDNNRSNPALDEKSTEMEKRINLEETPFISQKDYRPTPFASERWEYVGDRPEALQFSPLQMDILKQGLVDADPMFECFDKGKEASDKFWHTMDGKDVTPESEPEILNQNAALTEEEKKELYQKAYDEGYALGVAESKDKIVKTYEAIGGQVNQIADEIKKQAEARLVEIEKNAVKLSLEIAKKILETTVAMEPEYIVSVVKRALKSCGTSSSIKIRVSPNDYEFLQVVGLPVNIVPEDVAVEYVADENISGGCVVETGFGVVDLDIEEMWEEIKYSMIEAYKS